MTFDRRYGEPENDDAKDQRNIALNPSLSKFLDFPLF